MVFPNDGEVKLIDFDLTDKVGVDYPLSYNYTLKERSPNASIAKKLAIVHDCYSLIKIISAVNLTKEMNSKLCKLLASQTLGHTIFIIMPHCIVIILLTN